MSPRTPKKTSTQLSNDDIALLQQARNAQSSFAALGMMEEAPEPVLERQYDNFIEITGLPSGGAYYSTPIYGQPLKVPDLLQIQTLDESNVNQRFTEIFSRRLKGINPAEILIADELYIALWLRANSFPGFDFPNLPFTCTSCEYNSNMEESNFNFNQINFEIKNHDVISAELAGADFTTVELPLSKKQVKIYIRRRKHQSKVDYTVKRDYTAYNRVVDDETMELLNLAVVLDLGFNDLKESVAFIKDMNPVDFIFLIKNTNKFSLASSPVVDYICPSCGESTSSWGYPFRPEIFLPIDN